MPSLWQPSGASPSGSADEALCPSLAQIGLRWRAPLVAALVAIGYSVTDELHQLSVQGRFGSVHDVAIDAAGVALAWLLTRAVRQRSRLAASAAARSPERTAPSM